MASNELILGILCLLLAATSGLCEERNDSMTIDDDGLRAIEDPQGGRIFFSSFKKWFLGYGTTEKPVKLEKPVITRKTKVKVLPVYIPVPLYSNGHIPPSNEYYGAFQKKPGSNIPTAPYWLYPSQVQQSTYYNQDMEDSYSDPYNTYSTGYQSVGPGNEEHDAVVIDNPDLDMKLENKVMILANRDLVDHARRRKKYKKRKLFRE